MPTEPQQGANKGLHTRQRLPLAAGTEYKFGCGSAAPDGRGARWRVITNDHLPLGQPHHETGGAREHVVARQGATGGLTTKWTLPSAATISGAIAA